MRWPIPKYLTIKSVLQTRLRREMVAGQRLPAEGTLCNDFGVSRITMQQALALLEDEGWIRREQGRGTFYLGPQSDRVEQKPSELLETLMSHRDGAETRVLRKTVQEPPPHIVEWLALAPGARVVVLERLGLVEGEPIVFIYSYLPYALGLQLCAEAKDLERMTIAAQLADKHGIEISEVKQTISASLADTGFAEELGVEIGAPVLEGQRTYFDAAGRPIYCATSFYRADRHCFVVRLKNWRSPSGNGEDIGR
jgi:GntR family transcriptional regulator